MDQANAYLEALATAHIAGKNFVESHNEGVLAIESVVFAEKMDTDNAEYEFNLYCTEGPGVKAADILAGMVGERNKAFWNTATYRAMGARADWLAA